MSGIAQTIVRLLLLPLVAVAVITMLVVMWADQWLVAQTEAERARRAGL